MAAENLKKGSIITNNKLQEIFKCGSQGGMRFSKRTNCLVLISDHTKGIYQDKWIGEILHYTGMGLKGDQRLDYRSNDILAKSESNNVELHLFEVFKRGKYFYHGKVKLAGKPYQTNQPDINGNLRKVWIFPLKTADDSSVYIPHEMLKSKEEYHKKQARKLSENDLQKRAKNNIGPPAERKIITKVFEKDQYVAEYAKRRAKGTCQLCGNPAPFLDKDGKPYLETHHIKWLLRGGEDSIDNTVALCPNCHRKMHIVNDPKDIKKLKACILSMR